MHYTVLDWALHAKQQGETGADDLLAYLKTNWPTIAAVSLGSPPGSKLHLQLRLREKHGAGSTSETERQALTDGLATPITDGVGAEMMARMGWVRGEVLGASGQGLAEPLQPDLKHEHRQGLGYSN